jgi:hypothetical protein
LRVENAVFKCLNLGSISTVSALKTLVVTLQSIQAAYDLEKGISLGRYALSVALPDIFRPVAITGLFRLPASLWLTDDYSYAAFGSTADEVLNMIEPQEQLSPTSLPVSRRSETTADIELSTTSGGLTLTTDLNLTLICFKIT